MKLTKNETTVMNDLGINPDWEEHPVTAAQTVRKILGNGLAGAKSVLRSLENKGLLETVDPDSEDAVIQFSEKGLEWITSNIDEADPDLIKELAAAADEDALDEATDEIEVDLDEDDDEPESKSMVKQAAKKALKKAAKADSKKTPGATRTSHAGCEHESSKAARAKCRKERAKAAASA